VKLILKCIGSKKQVQVTEEELIAMASIGEEEGTIDKNERELIENVLEFNDIKVEGIMTPRTHINALPEEQDLEKATEFVLHHPHSRIPIYRGSMDNIVGILSLKDLLKEVHAAEEPDDITLRQIELQKPLKVSNDLSIQQLFYQFKNKRTHMAVVFDEKGKTIGIITMEDLLEELVGDIEDETDDNEAHIKALEDGKYELNGRLELDELTDLTGLKFNHPEYKTLSFLIIDELGYLPKKGQNIMIGVWEFKITQMHRHTILKVQLQKLN